MPASAPQTDPLDIPHFLRIPQAERDAHWATFRPRPQADADPKAAAEARVAAAKAAERARRAAAEAAREAARANRPQRQAAPSALVYRTGRWCFVPLSRVRPGEEHYTEATYRQQTSTADAANARLDRPAAKAKAKAAPGKPKRLPKALGGSKTIATITEMLRRPKGATLAELSKATGTAPHSCRAKFAAMRRAGLLVNPVEDGGKGNDRRFKIED